MRVGGVSDGHRTQRGLTSRYHGSDTRRPPVLTLLADRNARARVSEAMRAHASVTHCESPRVLLDEASKGAYLVVLEARDPAGVSTSELVRELRTRWPFLAVIGYVDPTGGSPSRDAAILARAGVHELVIRGFDDCGLALRQTLAQALHGPTAEIVLAAVAPALPSPALPFVRYCLEHASRSLSVQQVARALGVHRKTLALRLRCCALPPPRVIIAWSRLLTAARLLEISGPPVEQIALELDFPSAGALRNLLKRHTRRRPRELRGAGAFDRLLEEFRLTLLHSRAASGRRESPMRG